jgi:hypothetical protein
MEHKEQTQRYLTSFEIQDILLKIPNIKAAAFKIAQYETHQIKEKLRNQLREIKVYPENIPRLTGIILNQFHRSIIPAGESIGPSTSEGIGGPATQMTLNTFHQAGSVVDIASGLDKLRELLNMTKERKSKISYIHFKNKDLTQEEVVDLRRSVVGVSISKLMSKNPEIKMTTEGLPGGGIRKIPLKDRGWWYNAYIAMNGKSDNDNKEDFESVSCYLRVKLDRDKMYAYRVTSHDIANTIMSDQNGIANCVISPYINKLLYVDIYIKSRDAIPSLNEHVNGSNKGENLSFTDESFSILTHIIKPKLIDEGSYTIKGIRGITQITPKCENVMKIVHSVVASKRDDDVGEDLLKKGSKEDMWFFWINDVTVRSEGIPLSKLIKLIKACGITIIESPEEKDNDPYSIYPKEWKQPDISPRRIVVLMEGKLKNIDPKKHMELLIGKANDFENDRILSKTGGNGKVSDIIRHSKYCYAIGTGTNLRAMLRHPDIDGNQSISNDIGISKHGNDIYSVIGIQASYSSIVKDFHQTITGAGAYCSPQHITTLASSMTNFTPSAITSRGVIRQNRGAFADASFEHAVEVFVKQKLHLLLLLLSSLVIVETLVQVPLK